jgi:hypothetical protein
MEARLKQEAKLFSYQHRHSDFDPSHYRLSSPSGLSLCLANCDKDTGAFIDEANAPIAELSLLRADLARERERVRDLRLLVKEYRHSSNSHGTFCSHYFNRGRDICSICTRADLLLEPSPAPAKEDM